MILFNRKMKKYLDMGINNNISELETLVFIRLGAGFFFDREVNENVRTVANVYSADPDCDWAGFEYGTNKLHLENEMQAPLSDVAAAGICLAQRLADRFKKQFPDSKAIFWLGCDEFGEYPSVTLGFYVKREGMTPLLPEDGFSLEKFSNAILIVI